MGIQSGENRRDLSALHLSFPGVVPGPMVGGTALARCGQVVAQVIVIDQVIALCAKHPLGLIGNPGCTVADGVDPGVGIQADTRGAQAKLVAGRIHSCGARPEDRVDAALRIDQPQTRLFPTEHTALALIALVGRVPSHDRDHAAVGLRNQLRHAVPTRGFSLHQVRLAV